MPLHVTTCYLENVDDPSIKINLPHKVKVPLGMVMFPLGCPESEAHVFVEADLDERTVLVENAGRGNTWHGGHQLGLTRKVTLMNGDHLALQEGEEIYVVKFFPLLQDPNRIIKGENSNLRVRVRNSCCEPKPSKREWENIKNELLVYTPPKIKSSCLIAGFGLLGTLVKVKYTSKNCMQWKFAFEGIPQKLKCLQKRGYKIAIFTNNVLTERLRLSSFKKRISTLMRRIGVPIQVFMCTSKGLMRKPVTGMWCTFAKRNNNQIVNTTKSFYVGRLAGRKENWKDCAPADPSNQDRLFACNIGVKFFTPEEYFCNAPVAPYRFPKYNPREPCTFDVNCLLSQCQEMVVMVGPPDSGKTWICKHHLVPAGYVHITINFVVEMLRSKQIIKEFLKKGKSVVVDGMNPSAESRKTFVCIAKKHCVNVRCFRMKVSKEQLAHNRRFRQLVEMKDSFKQDDKILIYDSFYQKPDKTEGFHEIVQVHFAPTFNDPKLNTLYHMFLLSN